MSRIFTEPWEDYELIDAGNGRKLERFGKVVMIRPERNAYFKQILAEKEWLGQAQLQFTEGGKHSGHWEVLRGSPEVEWKMAYEDLRFIVRTTQWKHVGVFPEQRQNWDYIMSRTKPGDQFLNLFGYTGCASLAARKAGASVCHCDSVKQVIAWGKENMELSGLQDIRWICDDAAKFASKEIKRGKKYDGIIMDPPTYGMGTNKERWKIEDQIYDLVRTAANLLTEKGFLIVNTYSPLLGQVVLQEIIKSEFPTGKIEIGKLCILSGTEKVIEYGDLCRVDKSV